MKFSIIVVCLNPGTKLNQTLDSILAQTCPDFEVIVKDGGKRGSLAVLIYILLGAVGIPVFAGFSGGIGVLLGNTGGYIVGFLFSALLMWLIEKLFGRKTWCSLFCAFF